MRLTEDGSFLQPPVTSSLLGSNIFLSTLFPKTLNLCSFLNVRQQISHPYETTDKNYSLVYFNLYILDSRQEDKKILKCMVACIFPHECSSDCKFCIFRGKICVRLCLQISQNNPVRLYLVPRYYTSKYPETKKSRR
jgi:hypothetical protein